MLGYSNNFSIVRDDLGRVTGNVSVVDMPRHPSLIYSRLNNQLEDNAEHSAYSPISLFP